MAKALFETGHQGLFVSRLDIDDSVRPEPGLAERRGEQVGPGDAPQDGSAQAGDDARREQGRGGAAAGLLAAACDFVQGAQGEAAAGQDCVHLGDPERQDVRRAAGGVLKGAHLCA